MTVTNPARWRLRVVWSEHRTDKQRRVKSFLFAGKTKHHGGAISLVKYFYTNYFFFRNAKEAYYS